MGHITVADQTVTFLLSLALGAIFCVFYDVFRCFHIRCKSWATVFISDILFWLIAAVAVFCFFVLRTMGQVRGYALLGVALGFVAGRLLFGNTILRLFCRIERLFCAVLQLLLGPMRSFFVFLQKICKKIGRIIKKGLKNLKSLLYNTSNKLNKKRSKLWVHKKSEK